MFKLMWVATRNAAKNGNRKFAGKLAKICTIGCA